MDYLTAISSVGFPIVAFFFMSFRIERTVCKNTEAINQLKEAIIKSGKVY